ncbi:MAG: hypothetical protein QME12_04060 [Nanoarchaeota archaeon]|nr:hypothetical protein [Nanoarchaeota archaeon]
MQKLTLIGIIVAVLALMPFASAANTYALKEFTKDNSMQAIVLEKGDIVEFNLLDGTHSLRVKEIARSNTSIKLNVYPFTSKGASMAQQIPFFGLDNVVKVDLDRDGQEDVLLDIYEINDRRVTLVIVSAKDRAEAQEEAALEAMPEITGTPEGQGVVKEQKDYSKTYWAVAIAIILLGAFLYAKAINAKKEKPHPKKELED